MTAYGVSETFYLDNKKQWFRGLMQDNGAVSPGFLIIAIMLVRSLYSKGLVMDSVTPISQVIFTLAGQIFVDDTDLNMINKENENVEEIMFRAQQTLDQWH